MNDAFSLPYYPLPLDVLLFLDAHHGSFTRPAIQEAINCVAHDAGPEDTDPEANAEQLSIRLRTFAESLFEIADGIDRITEKDA